MGVSVLACEAGNPDVSAAQLWAWLRSKARVTLLLAYFVLLYTSMPLVLDSGVQVPTFWVLPVTALYALLFGCRVYRTDLLFVAVIMSVALASIVFAGEWTDVTERFESVAMLLAALLNGVVFLQMMERVDRGAVGRILLFLFCVIMIGAVLEVFGLLRGVSDAFRIWAFSTDYARFDPTYAHSRDIAMVGFIRPNFFTSETSNLAKGFLVFSNAWLLLGYNRRKFGFVAVCNATMLLITGSLAMLVSLFTAVVIALLSERNIKYLVTLLVVCAVGAVVFAIGMRDEVHKIVTRLDVLLNSAETVPVVSSVAVRLVFPFITLFDVLSQRPFFGVGIGGTDAVEQYASLRLPVHLAIGNNGLAGLFLYFGLAGVFLISVAVIRYCARKGVRDVLLLFIVLIGVLQTMGDAWTIRLWAYFFLFVAVLRHAGNNVRYSGGGAQRIVWSGHLAGRS